MFPWEIWGDSSSCSSAWLVAPFLLPEAFPQSTGADFKGNSPALPSSWPAEWCWGPGWRTAGPLDPVEEKGWEFFFGQNCRE